MPISVIQGSAVVLQQNVIYRARLEVVPPFGPAATEGAVTDELGKQGFADVRFYDRSRLPSDWPPAEGKDESGFMGKSYYLEGRFTLTGRTIPLSELGTKVSLKGMWVYLVPVPVPVPTPPRVPPGDSTPEPPFVLGALGEKGSKMVVGWLVAGLAYGWTRRLRARHRRRVR